MAAPPQQEDFTRDGLMDEDEGQKITEEGNMANRPTIESSSETEEEEIMYKGKKPIKLPPESKEEEIVNEEVMAARNLDLDEIMLADVIQSQSTVSAWRAMMDDLTTMNELGERSLSKAIEELQLLRQDIWSDMEGDSIREKRKEAKLLQEMMHQERSYGNRNGAIGPAGTSGRP